MRSVRSRVIVFGVLALLLAACGGAPGSAPTGGTKARSASVHVALPAGPLPSKSAKDGLRSRGATRAAIVLGVKTVAPFSPTWVRHLYSCRYVYANGVMVLSVKELSNRAQTTSYFQMLGHELGDTGRITDLGQGAFSTTDGSVVVRKDYKVLLVDISGLPARFGAPATSAADAAISVADTIMGCWSGS